MSKKVGNQTIVFENKPAVKGFYTIAGFKEGEGNFKDYFDMILENDKFGEKTFEHAERKLIETTIKSAIKQAKLKEDNIDLAVGLEILSHVGDKVEKGQVIAKAYVNEKGKDDITQEILKAYVITDKPVDNKAIILDCIK